jgi:hypothetical protein
MRYVVHWDGCNLQGRAGQGRAGMVFARERRRKKGPGGWISRVVWREG